MEITSRCVVQLLKPVCQSGRANHGGDVDQFGGTLLRRYVMDKLSASTEVVIWVKGFGVALHL